MSTSHWPVHKVLLSPPPLADLARQILSGLQSHFRSVTVSVSECPDLSQAPFHLAARGLCGHPRIADVGGPPYLSPRPDFTKKYDLLSISQMMEMSPDGGFLLGAGAGPFHVLGVNSELMPNLSYGSAALDPTTRLENRTHYAMITDKGDVLCEKVEDQTKGFGLMANLLGSDGSTGPLLHITAQSRTGPLNFTEAIQQSIKAVYGNKLVSLGGVFLIRHGKANLHVMPDFSDKPLPDRTDVEGWLRYFDMQAPLICLSVFHSGDDQGLRLRMEHTHCFSVDGGGRGGHYHYDLDETREEVEYEAWFNVAEVLYRIDQPGL